jgi:hypothetical protein
MFKKLCGDVKLGEDVTAQREPAKGQRAAGRRVCQAQRLVTCWITCWKIETPFVHPDGETTLERGSKQAAVMATVCDRSKRRQTLRMGYKVTLLYHSVSRLFGRLGCEAEMKELDHETASIEKNVVFLC